jgi:hypothetical protein
MRAQAEGHVPVHRHQLGETVIFRVSRIRSRNAALAQSFLNLLSDWREDGGSLLRWSQRRHVVALPHLRSDLISDRAAERLRDQRDGILARLPISPHAITRASM